MPRALKQQVAPNSSFYQPPPFTTSQSYLSDDSSSSTQPSPMPPSTQLPCPTPAASKKKHTCPTCDRGFTTSGHLARHSRVHTGERNHKCPFPGCETRCSRQDNLQQHYRIHLSPGSRRSSTRSAITRAMHNGGGRRSSTVSSAPESPSSEPPPLSEPPALEPARIYNHQSTPPDSPPPLAHATLPATAQPLPDACSTRSSSSPEASYSPIPHHLSQMVSMSSQPMNQQQYSYRSGTTTYQEQSQSAGFTYVHTTPVSHPSSSSTQNMNNSYYSDSNGYDEHSIPHINTSSPVLHQEHLQNSPSPTSSVSISSRHSISHISHPYTQNSSGGPPSPESASSHTSGPPTPTYAVFHDDAHAYHHGSAMISDQPGLSQGHISPQGHLVHAGYSPTIPVHSGSLSGRFSPPPVLAPIQDDRQIRREERLHPSQLQSHLPSQYIHHPQPLTSQYQYHNQHSIGMGHGAWKSDGTLRKGALVQ